jgi:hypothetical protein
MKTDYKYNPGTRIARAIYSRGHGPEMDSNPLVAALEPTWTSESIAQAMLWWPIYEDGHRRLPFEERLEKAQRLQYCFEPLSNYLPIIKGVLSSIRLGLIGRDRFVHGYTEEIRQKTVEMMGELIAPPPESKGQTIMIYGLPGNGKTWLINRISCLLPQVIDHTEFHGSEWKCRQVTHLRVVIQSDWSQKALAQAMVEEFDRVANTAYGSRAKMGANPSGFNYLMQFNLAAHNHGLGALFLDEVQLLKGNMDLLNFLLNFSTLVGVPLILVGTPSSKDIMQKDPRYMRRAEVPYPTELAPFSFPDTDAATYNAMLAAPDGPRDPWTYFVEAFWPLQYTSEFTPLTHALSFQLHYECAGLIDYAIKLFIAAQLLRIGTENDRLDDAAFREAYLTCFKISIPYLEALREGKIANLTKFEDFTTVAVQDIAIQAAKVRLEAANRDEQSRLETVRRQLRNTSRRSPAGPPGNPDPVSRNDVPKATNDELLP